MGKELIECLSKYTYQEISAEYWLTNLCTTEIIRSGVFDSKPAEKWTTDDLDQIQALWDSGMGTICISKQFGTSPYEIDKLFKNNILKKTERIPDRYRVEEKYMPVIKMYNAGYTIKQITDQGYTSGAIQQALYGKLEHLKISKEERLKATRDKIRKDRKEALNLYFNK